MVSKEKSEAYVGILRAELIPALGCTEPIAVALAAAKAREALGAMPDRVEMVLSGNIVKNVKGVVVPNSGGLKGIEAAALAGIVGGDASRGLEVLETLTAEHLVEVRRLLDAGVCSTSLAQGVESLYIEARLFAGPDSAVAVIRGTHTGLSFVSRNGGTLFEAPMKTEGADAGGAGAEGAPLSGVEDDELNVREILEFADGVDLSLVRDIISEQIRLNTAISDEGLAHHYGVDVGRTLLEHRGEDLRTRAEARAAAGSDARMSGCSMPVVINSGSGNQGMAASLPVIEYAKGLMLPEEKLYRALIVSNLVAIHQKRQIGRLSAFCGAVSAAAGSGAGISYLCGGGYEEVSDTIVNTIATIGGMVCDGAKPSCAAKIASAVDAAILAHDMSSSGRVFGSGDGLVKGDVEATIASVGRMGRVGMKGTDEEILTIMIDKKKGGEKI
jgi:L-cysteine desulfidase